MIRTVYVGTERISLDPANAIGKGGEADVYRWGSKALKVYKQPDHPDFATSATDRLAAELRIKEQQQKLPAFPKNLPLRVVSPEELARDSNQRIIGFTMPLLANTEVMMRYGQKPFRQAGISNEMVVDIFRDLYQTVQGIHKAQVEIGDFNDLNVLINGTQASIIDADSFQFGGFYCRTFTAKFGDPLLMKPTTKKQEEEGMGSFILAKPHNQFSDWYAFAVMLMQSLLFVEPYGGIYVPKNKTDRLPHPKRPLHRITIFHPEVRYPKPAIPMEVLPDSLLEWFRQAFVEDRREEFPLRLLDELNWTKCPNCGIEHSRRSCPRCSFAVPVAPIRGKVTVTPVFKTTGQILFAALQDGKLRYLYHDDGKFLREDGSVVINGQFDPFMRFRIMGEATLLGKNGQVVTLYSDGRRENLTVDTYASTTLPIFDANARSRYWTAGNQLLKDGQWAPTKIGEVLSKQTLFWVGPAFGFGFYRAGSLSVAFTFDANSIGINDSVKLPQIQGQIVDSTTYFTNDRCWFLATLQYQGQTINRCTIIRRDGTIEATAEAVDGDETWLGTIRGKCVAGNFMLAPTDNGIVRVEPSGSGQITQTREFPDTEPYVDTATYLFPGNQGIYVVRRREINHLTLG